jgi:hypothetical protein
MKKNILGLTFIVMLVGLFSSCDEDILTQDFTIPLTQEFVVNTTDSIFAIDTLLDAAAQSEDITKYTDNIEDFILEKVTYELTAFVGAPDQTAVIGTIDVADTNGTNQVNLTSLANVNLMSLLNNETELPLNQAGATFLANQLKASPFAAKVILSGAANKAPLNFTVKFKFYVKMKAKIA